MLSHCPSCGPAGKGTAGKSRWSALSLAKADRRLGACSAGCAEGAPRAVSRSGLLQANCRLDGRIYLLGSWPSGTTEPTSSMVASAYSRPA